jgi:hypothetical protein
MRNSGTSTKILAISLSLNFLFVTRKISIILKSDSRIK